MKNKILVISTRNLFEKNTIFEKADISPEASNELKKYTTSFINSRIDDLRERGEKFTQDKLQNIVLGDLKIIDKFLKNKNAEFFSKEKEVVESALTEELPQEVVDKIYKIVDTYLADDSDEINSAEDNGIQTWLKTINGKLIEKLQSIDNDGNYEKERVAESIRYLKEFIVTSSGDSENKEFIYFKMLLPDFDEFIDGYEAVNIDGEGLNMIDRISLFNIAFDKGTDIEGNDIRYYIYAIYPLGYPDNDEYIINEANEKVHTNSIWVNCITDAVIENSNAEKSKDTEIILLLHDKDLNTTEKMPFKTLYANKEDYKNVKRTLTVYQHSSPFFNKIRTCIGEAKDIFSCAEKLIINDLIFQYWKELSDILASYKGKQDIDKLEKILKDFKGTNLENKCPTFETVINRIIGNPSDIEQFYYTIKEVNNSIKTLRIMNS